MENVNQHEQEVELTAEELAEKKEQMLKFYTESLPYLKAQAEYEKILLEIDEARFKRTTIQYQYAMMNQQQDGPEIEEESEQERKLKTN
jgi:hypothetical protein